jgi:hypothetical protein
MGEERKVYKVLVGKPKGKRPLGRPRRRWEDGIQARAHCPWPIRLLVLYEKPLV